MSRHKFDGISTSALRAMLIGLAPWPWCRLLRGFRADLENELLARELPRIADETGGFPCVAVEGVQ